MSELVPGGEKRLGAGWKILAFLLALSPVNGLAFFLLEKGLGLRRLVHGPAGRVKAVAAGGVVQPRPGGDGGAAPAEGGAGGGGPGPARRRIASGTTSGWLKASISKSGAKRLMPWWWMLLTRARRRPGYICARCVPETNSIS